MGKTRHGKDWKTEHQKDQYVQRAIKEGHRSRAIYKLEEMDARDHLFKPGMTVIDLGAAPGSWSEFAAQKVGEKGMVIALDLLDMGSIPNVSFIQGDFREQEVYDALLKALDGRKVDLVMSDMAPNISGIKAVDQPRAMYLVELSLELAQSVLNKNGALLVKVFSGAGLEEFTRELRKHFTRVVSRKPRASRPRSAEHYLLATGYNV